MMTPKKLFGVRIKSLRERKGWTQENLAEKMDISPNYLSSIERGKENPTFGNRGRILTFDYLC